MWQFILQSMLLIWKTKKELGFGGGGFFFFRGGGGGGGGGGFFGGEGGGSGCHST